MANFRPFISKKKPGAQRPLKFWNAEVMVSVDPRELAPGASAQHSVSIENFNPLHRVEMTLKATCRGPHLRYGAAPTWEPVSSLCNAKSRVDPAALTTVTLPAGTDAASLPCIEQIEVRITLEWEDASDTTSSSDVSTLKLIP